jgi:hypothetical protein
MALDLNDTAGDAAKDNPSRLNTLVAITVALLATFTGLCKVKDDNVVQAMQQAQADKIDHWAWYQAIHIREEMLADRLALLRVQRNSADPARQADYDTEIAATEGRLRHETEHKDEVSAQAKGDQEKYDSFNYRDDQFDLSDAMMALAIALLAITALVQQPWLYALALIPSFIGVLMGLSGLLGWQIHSDFLAALLS